ncbi:glycosyltransferase family 2 protein [Archangium primigenium]|uniref:glycosyltransferase family 2 protein n=1 Tax=[Archangium] primigenium TaxID=2792470 RepID=UPI00195801F5|nr:glycosyltransferase [Archangium primigenium]
MTRGPEVLQELGRTLSRTRHVLEVQPASDVVARPGASDFAWEATGSQPTVALRSSRRALPSGWVWLELILRREGETEEAPLLFVTGATSAEVIRLPPPTHGLLRALVHLPAQVDALRLGVASRPLRFSVERVSVWEVGHAEASLRLALPMLTRLASDPERLTRAARKWWGVLRTQGPEGVVRTLREKSRGERPLESYEEWVRQYDTLDDTDRAAIRRRLEGLSLQPLISVVMPTYETPASLLREALDSVRQQLYPNWELCIADDASRSPDVKAVLAEYAAKDARIRYVVRPENGHISAASNSALALVRGEFIALLDHDDLLPEHALYRVVEELNAHPDADVLYSDEDKLDTQGRRFDPYFKPDWNLELFRAQNLISHLGVYRTSLVREVGGFRTGVEGSQDYDLALRVVERVPASHIRHIPLVLYHWRAIPGSTALSLGEKDYATRAARRALTEHYARVGDGRIQHAPSESGKLHASVYPLPEPRPLVSLIVSSRAGVRTRALHDSLARSTWSPFELIEVEGAGQDSARLNAAAARAQGTVWVWLQDSVEILTPDWLEPLVARALVEDVGAVGARLFAPDDTLHHGGLLLGVGGAVASSHAGLARGQGGYVERGSVQQEFSAVSAACLVMRRAVFEAVGGFDAERFPSAYNDVDLCLRLRERGYRVLWTPVATLRQHDTSVGVFPQEAAALRARWPAWFQDDPFYNPNLTLERGDHGLAWPPRVKRPWRS